MKVRAGTRVLLAYSGGLDTSYLVAWLTHEHACEVTALTVDCGGTTPKERRAREQRALACGAVAYRAVDARGDLFDRVLCYLIAGNARRGETYPLCVAAERGIQAEVLADLARREAFDAVAHGCTGAGNDQVRFESALAVVAGEVLVLAPIRDAAVQREEERAYLARHGVVVERAESTYSVNQGLWGLTIGGGVLLASRDPLPEEAWRWTRGAPHPGARSGVRVDFERGVPVALDGRKRAPVPLIEQLNRMGGAAGVGRGYHLGDTVLGHKGRIAYEAPAAEILLAAHRELEKLVLTEEQRLWKDQLASGYGRLLHRGQLHEPALRDIEAFLASSQARVTGSVRVAFRGGSAVVEGLESPFSLLAASDARYGERPAGGSNAQGAVWLARTLAEPARLARLAGRAAGAPEEVLR